MVGKIRTAKKHTSRPEGPYHGQQEVIDVEIVDAEEVEQGAAAAAAAGDDMEDNAPPRSKPLKKPEFAAMKAGAAGAAEHRRVPVPQHRVTPLKNAWKSIYEPLVQHMHLEVRMNVRSRHVELRTSKTTKETSALQKGADFVKAFLLGFEVQDAIALLRLDELYIESFEVKDVKTLHGDHMARAIGRVAGKGGKTKFAIENSTRTRVVVADSKIHILGSFSNIRIARDAICDLILGAPPSKVYTKLRTVASRLKERL